MPGQQGRHAGTPVSERERLARGLADLGIPATGEKIDRLLTFAGLVHKWAGSYNLVARGDLDQLVGRHILDSLAIHAHVTPGSLLDVGSGAGFPGIPLALVMPGLEVTLLDSSGKKIRFLRHVKRTLGLDNVSIVHARLDEYRPGSYFPAICCRAFGPLCEFVAGVRHLAGPRTRILAMKGRHPRRELNELPSWVQVVAVEPVSVPDLHAERHLVIMCVSPKTRVSNDNDRWQE